MLLVLDIFAIVVSALLGRARARRPQRRGGRRAPTGAGQGRSRAATSSAAALLASLCVFGAEFGAGRRLAFLWPNLKGGFGSLINAGQLSDIKAQIDQTDQPVYFGAGRFYIVPYNGTPGTAPATTRGGVTSDGSWPCTSGACTWGAACRSATSSKWFECPCHGSKYNEAGEYQLGPAPRGLDRFQMTVVDGSVIRRHLDDQAGPPRGTEHDPRAARGPVLRGAGIDRVHELAAVTLHRRRWRV